MPRTPRRTSLIGALAALALLAGACGDDDDATDTTTTTTEASDEDVTTTTTEADDDDDGDDDGDPSDLTAEDLLEAVERTKAADSARVEVDASFDGGPMLGTQEFRLGGPVAMDGTEGEITMEMAGQGGAIEIVLADGQAWIGGDMPDVRAALPEGAEWAQASQEELLASGGFDNPGNLAFLYVVGGAEDVREDGDVIRFDIDMEAAAASAPPELRDEVAATITFTGDGEPEITGAVTVDDEGRITSLQILGVHRPTAEEAEQLPIDGDLELRVSFDVTIEDFDEPLDVSAPDGVIVPISEAPELARMLEMG